MADERTEDTKQEPQENAIPDEKEETVPTEAAADSSKKEEQDFKNRYYYLAAEMDNMRKRFAREKESIIKYGNEKVLSSLIDVVDNLDTSFNALANEADEKIKNIANGIDMVRKQFLNVLTQNGLEQVKAVGEIFDPNFHEALMQQPAEGKKDNEIISEYKKGYILNGRLLRPAKVIVAKTE